MKKNFKIIFLSIFICTGAYSQEVDLDLLSELTPEQIQMAQDQLAITKNIEKPAPQISESTIKIESEASVDNEKGLTKYGYDYFSSAPTNIAAIGDLPLPNEYKISLKDQFSIILSGSKEAIFDLDVNLDGTILFPELGSISVVGETLREVKNKLINLIEQSYIGVQIDVSLKNLAAKKITIVGAVNNPGTYLVNPFSTISSSLAYSGGISDIGTLRKIKLVRANGEIFLFDLYKLLIDGNRDNDITVEAGDVIVIDAANQFIELTGEVKRPSIYEVIEGEDISDLISFGLGFTITANKTNIDADVLDLGNGVIKSITTNNLSQSLSSFLSVNINPYQNKSVSNVRVVGAVKEPGFYSLSKYKNLEDLINDIEFINVYPWLGVLEQFDEDKLSRKTILFSLKDKNTYQDIDLLPNSKVFFSDRDLRTFNVDPMTKELIDNYKLSINHNDDTFALPVFGRFSLQSLVDFLGLDMTSIDKLATYVSPLDNQVIEAEYSSMNFVSKKFNTVTFKSPVNDLITVSVRGAIDYPGTYTLQADASLEDLYFMMGDFKPDAFLDGIIFTREIIRDSQLDSLEKSKKELNQALSSEILNSDELKPEKLELASMLSLEISSESLGRVAGDFSPNNNNIEKTKLLDGDSIFVPRSPNFINVLGEVLNPLAFEYTSNLTINSAIANSGGMTKSADQRRIYVIKANGFIERKKRNIFIGGNNIEPGDTIVVPRKITTSNPALQAILPVTNIISDLAFSAAAIESLSNNN